MIVWERTDDFDSTEPYGDRLCSYYTVTPSTAYTHGHLADFDNDDNPSPHGLDGANPNDPCIFGWRGDVGTNRSVSLTTSLKTTIGAFTGSQVREAGVAAKIQGGALAGAGGIQQYIDGADCYVFVMRGDAAASTVQFHLERIKGGVTTSLATSLVYPIDDNTLDGTKPFTLRMDVAETAGVAVGINCYLANFQSVSGPSPVTDFQVFTTVIDFWATAIQGAGHCGLVLGQDEQRTVGPFTADIYQKAHRFRIQDFAGASLGSVLHDDDFSRVNDTTYGVTSDTGQVGKSVQASFNFDLFHPNIYSNSYLRPASVSNAIEFVAPSTTELQVLAHSMRPATDPFRQHAQANIEFVNTGTGSVEGGVAVKASGVTGPGSQWLSARAYIALADPVAGRVSVYKVTGPAGSATTTELARYSTTIGYGTAYDVGLRSIPVGDDPVGPQTIELFWAGSKVSLTIQGSPAGITADGAGGLIDAASDRITNGPSESLAFWTLGTRPIRFYEWTEGTLTSGTAKPQDQASISFADEGTPSTTLEALLAQPIESRDGWAVDRTQFDSGHEIARTRHRTSRRVWPRLRTVPLTVSQKDALLAFWTARSGAVEAFLWESPEDQVTYSVRFIDGSLDLEELFRDVWVVSFGLEQTL